MTNLKRAAKFVKKLESVISDMTYKEAKRYLVREIAAILDEACVEARNEKELK